MPTPGIAAPPGTVLTQSKTLFDNDIATSAGAAAVFAGAVTFAGAVSTGPVPANDDNSALTPSSNGLTAWNYPYYLAAGVGSAVTTAGTLYLAKIPLAGGTVVTNIYIKIATAASGLTTAQNFAGLYNSAGQRVATTADLTSTIGTNTGAITCPLTTPYVVPSGGGNYWVGMFFNSGTTFPVLSAYTGFVTVTTSVATFGSATTFGNTAANFPFAVSATGSNTTALPASITMASNTATGAYTLWVGVD